MNKEIERKYAISYLPPNLKIEKVINIEQAFIYKDINTIIRIRKIEKIYDEKEKNDIEYIYTVKTKGDMQYTNDYNIGKKYEIESNIEKQVYEELLKNKISNIIEKTRIVSPIDNKLKAEIDIYYKYLEGLLTLEIEFPNEDKAKTFIKPNWIGEELGYKELSNRKLAEMTREKFETKVRKEFIENNKKIINELRLKKELKNIK